MLLHFPGGDGRKFRFENQTTVDWTWGILASISVTEQG